MTASAAALNGNRTTTPERGTTSTSGSATIRRGANADDADGFDAPGSAAGMRRRRSKFDRVSFRSRQIAWIVCPDRSQASISSRQVRTRPGLCRDRKEFSPPGKTDRLPDDGRRHVTGQVR
jgi:hypothetical protein